MLWLDMMERIVVNDDFGYDEVSVDVLLKKYKVGFFYYINLFCILFKILSKLLSSVFF